MLSQDPSLETITELLRADHRRIDALLGDLCAMVEDGELERADHAFGDLDSGLRHHIRAEEELLFPVFDERTGLAGPTSVMKHEHRHIERLLEELRQALGAGLRPTASLALTELLSVLGEHNLKEERILYPKTDLALTPDERRALVARVRNY